MEYECEYCGKRFEYTENSIDSRFCSKECLINAVKLYPNKYRKRERRFCKVCGQPFLWRVSRPECVWCSNKCKKEFLNTNNDDKNKYEKIEEPLIIKEDDKRVLHLSVENKTKSRAKKKTSKKVHKKTMSPMEKAIYDEVVYKVEILINQLSTVGDIVDGKCVNYWNRGDISEKTRNEVLDRDEYECLICKRKDHLELHHMIKRINGGNHNAENLVTLCSSCHRHIEAGDMMNAVNRCYKNALIYFDSKSLNNTGNSFDSYEIKTDLEEIYKMISNVNNDDFNEIMINLDDMIDQL